MTHGPQPDPVANRKPQAGALFSNQSSVAFVDQTGGDRCHVMDLLVFPLLFINEMDERQTEIIDFTFVFKAT